MRKRMMGKLRKISTTYYLRQIVACLLVYCMLLAVPMQVALAVDPPAPGALPSGGTVPVGYGSASFAYDYPNNDLAIGSLATQTVINWDNFDIGSLSSVNFNDAANFAVLNRVTGNTGTTGIYGDLFANGTIFVINTRGIVFGPDSFIQARNFVASGIDIQNDDFMNGIYKFEAFPVTGHPYSDVIGDVTNKGIGLNHGIDAELVALIGQNVTNIGIIRTTAPGGAVIMAAGDKVLLSEIGSNVVVQVTMTADPAQRVVDHGGSQGTGLGTIEAPGGKVILAAGDIFSTAISGVDSLAAVANKDITLGNIQAGEITLTADYDSVDGGNVIANGTLTSTTGNIEISASDSTIHINEDVTAEVDLLLNNDTEVAADKKLEAGRNVDLEANKVLKALGNLEIVAGTATSAPDGEILANTAIIDMSTGGTLTLTQNNSLDMTSNFNVDNRSNTDLVATSRAGSVTSAQADEWQSITAHAYTDIVLDDDVGGGDVKTGALTADTKDIVVISDLGKVIATENIEATLGDVSLTADEGIDVTKNITAGGGGDFGGIILDGTVTAVGTDDQKFDAEAGTLWAKDTPGRIATITKPMAAPGKLTLAADTLVDLDGVDGTSGDSVHVEDGPLTIDGPVDAEGNLRASGVITLTGPANLAGDVISTGSGIVFDDDVIADGVGYQEFDAGSDWLIAENGADIDKITEGSLTLAGDLGIELGGDVRGSGLTSSDTITFENDVTADGTGAAEDQVFDADAGALAAAGTITKNDGRDLTLGGGAGLDLDGTVNVLTNRLFIEDDFTAEGDLLADGYMYIRRTSTPSTGTWVNGEFDGGNQKVEAGGGLIVNTGEWPESDEPYLEKTTTGDLELLAGYGIGIHAHVTVDDGKLDIIGGAPGSSVSLFGNLWSSGDMTLTSNGGGLQLNGNAESRDGSVEMTANGWDIRLYSQSWNYSEPWQGVKAGQDIILNDDTTVYYSGAVLEAGQDVIVGDGTADGTTLTGKGALTVEADRDITLGGAVAASDTVGGDLILKADADTVDGDTGAVVGGDMTAHGTIHNPDGSIDIYSSDGTTILSGDWVEASDDITLHNNTELDGDVDQRIEARNGVLWAQGTLTKTDTGDLYLAGGGASPSINLDDTVDVDYGSLIIEDDFIAEGDLLASGNVTFEGSIVNGELNGAGPQRIDAEGGTLLATGTLKKTTSGTLTLAGDTLVDLDGIDGTSGDSVTVSAGDLTIEDSVDVEGHLRASGHIHLQGTNNNLGGDVIATGSDITFDFPVNADDPGSQTFDAGTGTLWAKDTITKTVTGDLTLGGDTLVDLDGTVDVQTTGGSLTIEDHFSAEADLLANENVTFEGSSIVNGTLDGGISTPVNQNITATNGKVYASGWIHKTEEGNLDIFGGYDLGMGSAPYNYSVLTHAVTVDKGQLDITGDAFVVLVGSIESSGNMELTSGNGGWGYLAHTSGTIESLTGDVEMTANGFTILLQGGNATEYVTAFEDILLHDNTEVRVTEVRKLDAGDDVVLASGKSLTGNGALTLVAGDDIILGVTDVDNHASSPHIGTAGNVTARNDLILDADDDIYAHGDLISQEGSVELHSSNYTTNLYANVTADENVLLNNKTRLRGIGDQRVEATNGTLTANRDVDKTTDGALTLAGTLGIILGDDVSTDDGDLIFENAVEAVGTGSRSRRNQTFDADGDDKKLHAWDTITKTTEGNLTLSGGQGDGYEIDLDGDVTVEDGDLNLGSLLSLLFGGDDDTTVYAGGTLEASDDVKVYDYLNGEGDLTIIAGEDTIHLWSDTYAAGDLLLNANTEFEGWDDQYVDADGTLTASGYLRKLNKLLWWESDGSLYLHADGDISLAGYVQAADKKHICGYEGCGLLSYGGGVSIISDNGMIFTPAGEGDPTDTLNVPIIGRSVDVKGEGIGVNLPYGPGKAAIVIKSQEDLKLGTEAALTAYGLYKTYDSEGYLAALEALGSVGDFFAGVEGAEFGTFFDGVEGFGDFFDAFEDYDAFMDALDAHCGGDIRGVIFEGGWDGYLAYLAFKYDTAPDIFDSKPALGVDDRAGVGFLDVPDTHIPLGGPLRDEGDPFDVAIYVASTDGDVDVSGPVEILPMMQLVEVEPEPGSELRGEPEVECVEIPQGTMVIDAWDTVTFDGGVPGGLFETSLADGYVGDRLEVVSRITEWLFEASIYGTLPYPYGGGPFPLDYTYVLRGAGLGNGITDGRAWVLEDPTPPAPLYEEAGQAIEPLTLGLEGCPVLLVAVATELGVPGDTIEVSLANSFALNTDIQPCESCARLLNAATILRDEDGSRMAAMTQMFNDMAPGDSPYTPEMQALIVTAFAGAAEGSQYATVMQYTDAFVQYLAVLSTEMGSPVADGDSLAFIMGKYGAGVLGSDNSNIAAFVAARLESGETFGK